MSTRDKILEGLKQLAEDDHEPTGEESPGEIAVHAAAQQLAGMLPLMLAQVSEEEVEQGVMGIIGWMLAHRGSEAPELVLLQKDEYDRLLQLEEQAKVAEA